MGSKRLQKTLLLLSAFTKHMSNTYSRMSSIIGIAKKMVLEYPIHTAEKKVA